MWFNRSKSSLQALPIFSLVVSITTDTQLSTQVSFHIQRVGRFRHTDQQWWVIVNGSPKTFNYKMEGNYSDQHLISLVLYTCYSISHVCLSPNMAGASPITWPLTSCENTLCYSHSPTWMTRGYITGVHPQTAEVQLTSWQAFHWLWPRNGDRLL